MTVHKTADEVFGAMKCYDLDGKLVPWDVAKEWFKDGDTHRIVARDELPNGVMVSTVLLVFDHAFANHGPPVIFETMVFGPRRKDGGLGEALDEDRYCTLEQAKEGHRLLVERWARMGNTDVNTLN